MVKSSTMLSSVEVVAENDGGELSALNLSTAAVSALLEEAELTPKPALVDRRGNGAHHDLDLARLRRSAQCLQEGFADIARAAAVEKPSLRLREQIGRIGRDMERRMLAGDRWGNAHRGAISALGLLVAAAAHAGRREMPRASRPRRPPSHDCRTGLPARAAEQRRTARLRFGAAGARGEAQAAFPHAIHVGLPALARRVAAGCLKTVHDSTPSWPSCPALTILACSIAAAWLRLETARPVPEPYSSRAGRTAPGGMECLHRLHAQLMALWASPGGSADLLAVTLFLDRLDRKSRSVSSQ